MDESYDVVIIGGGIVGLATGYQLMRSRPRVRLAIIEKERQPGLHQTGHNSGVLHSGIYYKPGSLKARNCREGKRAMEAFCAEHDIPFEICGKVIVAVDETELPRLESILQRGIANGIRCERIDQDRLRELEPYAAGVAAIHVPEAGIVDYRAVCNVLARLLSEEGATLRYGSPVTGIEHRRDGVVVSCTVGSTLARLVINCGGLHSDRIARWTGSPPQAKIVPFRGEYYKLRPSVHHLCRNLIYPVPDPSFPFLGVHFTRMIDGDVECGPNAVLAFAREGYRKTDINLRDLAESLSYPGFLRLALRHWKMGAGEMWRSISKRAFVRALQRLLPAITSDDLTTAPAGVRAQAITASGQMVDDFLIVEGDRVVNVCNAPSPAATSSLNIGQLIVEKIGQVVD